jgi:hypothetical protein
VPSSSCRPFGENANALKTIVNDRESIRKYSLLNTIFLSLFFVFMIGVVFAEGLLNENISMDIKK